MWQIPLYIGPLCTTVSTQVVHSGSVAFNRDYLTSLGGADLVTLDGVRRN